MIINYIKTVLRNLKKQKFFSLVNITGLAIGMAGCLLIMLWVLDETGFDRFHKDSDQIYRVLLGIQSSGKSNPSSNTPNALGPALQKNLAGITDYTRYLGGFSGWLISNGDKSFTNDRWAAADPSFFQIFSFSFVAGNAETALYEKSSVVISEKMAEKYFGDGPALGKILKKDDVPLKVTGVIHMPEHSHLQFDYIFPIENMRQWFYQNLESWDPGMFKTYIRTSNNISLAALENQISGILASNTGHDKLAPRLQPLKEVHLSTPFKDQCNYKQGNITFVRIFTIIAFCVLLVACINFMNLSTSRAVSRTKEIGVRKVIGARRKELIIQFLSESTIFAIIALGIALLLVQLVLPHFNQFTGKQLSLFQTGPVNLPLWLAGITLFTGLLAGSYPALVLSSFYPITSLGKGATGTGPIHSGLRRILVILQFATASVMITGTLVLYQQLTFMQKADMGYEQDNILYFYGYGQFMNDYPSVRQTLLQNPNIVNISKSFPPFYPADEQSSDILWPGKDPQMDLMIQHKIVDYDYLDTFGMSMANGRFYDRQMTTDVNQFVLNETAVKKMGLSLPVGQSITYKGQTGQIIGVLKDFHNESFHSEISPFIFELYNGPCYICVKIAPDNIQQTLTFIESQWNEFVPDRQFSYTFFNDYVSGYYHNEQQTATLARNFAFLTIFISCMGLLGLAIYTLDKRTKEIGLRKILGATVSNVITMLFKDFITWILIANLIAWPISWYLLNQWLEQFAYRIELDLMPFLLGGMVAISVAALTISWQAVKAARANPVESLRYE